MADCFSSPVPEQPIHPSTTESRPYSPVLWKAVPPNAVTSLPPSSAASRSAFGITLSTIEPAAVKHELS